MLLGLVSDTHGQVEFARQAVRMLESLEVEQVIHCGDIGSPAIVGLFGQWPTHFVLGNVDYDANVLRSAIEAAGQTYHGRFGELELSGVRIAFLHSDDGKLFRDCVSSGRYDLVCYGHTHLARQHREGKTLVVNPGALYRANPHSIAVVELPECNVTHVTV
jgi:putative phosphoesterase